MRMHFGEHPRRPVMSPSAQGGLETANSVAGNLAPVNEPGDAGGNRPALQRLSQGALDLTRQVSGVPMPPPFVDPLPWLARALHGLMQVTGGWF